MTKPKETFKRGDYVSIRVKKPILGFGSVTQKSIGTIVHIDGKKSLVTVRFPEHYWYGYFSEIKKVLVRKKPMINKHKKPLMNRII